VTRFTRLRLSSFRNFSSIQLSLGDRLLIFGPNGAGKSSLLDAIRFLTELPSPGGLHGAVERRGGRYLRSLRAPTTGDVKIEIEADLEGEPWGYSLTFALDKQGLPRIRTEAVRHGRRRLLRRPEADDRREPLRLTQTHLEQASTAAPLSPLIDALRSVRSWSPHQPPSSLSRSILTTPKRPREARLRRVLELARAVFPRLDRIALDHDDLGVPQVVLRMDRGRNATLHPEPLLSPGTLRLLSLLWEATDGAGPLLLDDPEQGLHPEVVGRLLDLVAAAGPRTGRQLLVATHAERLLDDNRVAPSEILLLHAAPEGTLAELAAEDTQIRSIAAEDGPLGPIIAARTGPSGDGQIPLYFDPPTE
jgi:predicted ATPase